MPKVPKARRGQRVADPVRFAQNMSFPNDSMQQTALRAAADGER